MKISVITVCYNSESTIRSTIESVLSQSYSEVEYIVIDGLSTDKTMSIINEYINDIDIVLSEEDEGIYDAMNKGIKLATGDVIGILNSDDFYESDDTLATIADAFYENPTADLVFGDIVYVSPSNLDAIVRTYHSKSFKPWKLRFGWMPPHPGTFIKRSVYSMIGLYSLDYKISSDYEFFIRILLIRKLNYIYIGNTLVRMRSGGVSTSGLRNSFLLNSEIIRACKENGIYSNHIFLLFKIPFKLYSVSWKALISQKLKNYSL